MSINMKRKMIFLSSIEYHKDAVDTINTYFDKGYEIEEVLDADCGYYIFLVLKGDENYKYTHKFDLSDSKYPLIEEKVKWTQSSTTSKDIKMN